MNNNIAMPVGMKNQKKVRCFTRARQYLTDRKGANPSPVFPCEGPLEEALLFGGRDVGGFHVR